MSDRGRYRGSERQRGKKKKHRQRERQAFMRSDLNRYDLLSECLHALDPAGCSERRRAGESGKRGEGGDGGRGGSGEPQ